MSGPHADDGQLMTIEDLEKRWGISKNTIYKWRTQGIGPRGMKLGKHIRYRLEEIEVFEASRMESLREQTHNTGGHHDGDK